MSIQPKTKSSELIQKINDLRFKPLSEINQLELMKIQKGISALKKADAVEGWCVDGMLQTIRRDRKASFKCFEKARAIASNDTTALLNIGVNFKMWHCLDQAISMFEKVLELESNAFENWYTARKELWQTYVMAGYFTKGYNIVAECITEGQMNEEDELFLKNFNRLKEKVDSGTIKESEIIATTACALEVIDRNALFVDANAQEFSDDGSELTIYYGISSPFEELAELNWELALNLAENDISQGRVTCSFRSSANL